MMSVTRRDVSSEILVESFGRICTILTFLSNITVKRLSRVSIGNLKLNNLPVGKWRYLEDAEVDYLYKATRKANG
jgi:hypothetical protein